MKIIIASNEAMGITASGTTEPGSGNGEFVLEGKSLRESAVRELHRVLVRYVEELERSSKESVP